MKMSYNICFTQLLYKKHLLWLGIPVETALGVALDPQLKEIKVGEAEVLTRGSDLTLLAIGNMVNTAQQAAEILREEWQISCTVINARFIKPLDKDTIIKEIQKVKGLVTLEEHNLPGGFGSAILELLQENNIQMPVLRIGFRRWFCYSW